MHDPAETVVAVATPAGRGGLACVRLSGPSAPAIATRLFRAAHGAPCPGGRPRFGRFLDRDGAPLDHGYLVLFPARSSYTGEPTAEAWVHGSPVVVEELVQHAVHAGAVPAGPGEFTFRAMRNGRLDLARAEAVRDLIEARTRFQARVALGQAEGSLSRRLEPLREELAEWIARGEAAIEFVDESETHLPAGELRRAIAGAATRCRELLDGFRAGRVLRDGAKLVLVGRPNTGKSSLFNRLLSRDRAIVTEVPGTTRDVLEEEVDLFGVPVRLVDTAGLREVDDAVESEGVRRAYEARADADLVLLVLDASRPLEPEEHAALREAGEQAERDRTVVVLNKCDLERRCGGLPEPEPLEVSARTGARIDRLREELARRLGSPGAVEDPIMTNTRHAVAIEGALAALDRAGAAADAGFSEELLLEDLRDAMRQLGTITGEFTTEDLYDRLFATFCIGK